MQLSLRTTLLLEATLVFWALQKHSCLYIIHLNEYLFKSRYFSIFIKIVITVVIYLQVPQGKSADLENQQQGFSRHYRKQSFHSFNTAQTFNIFNQFTSAFLVLGCISKIFWQSSNNDTSSITSQCYY